MNRDFFIFLQSVAEKSEFLRRIIKETIERIQSKRDEAKANAERLEKAEFAISLCNRRVNKFLYFNISNFRLAAEKITRENLSKFRNRGRKSKL